MITHFELALFGFILDLEGSVFALFWEEFALGVAAFLGTGHIAQDMAIFTGDRYFFVLESLLFPTRECLLPIGLDFL